MKKTTAFKLFGYLIIIAVFGATISKLISAPQSDFYLQVGLIGYCLFLLIALFHIIKSEKVEIVEKFLWSLGLFCFFPIVTFLYLIHGYDKMKNSTAY